MATRNLLVRAGFDASGMRRGISQANSQLRDFGQNASRSMSNLGSSLGSTLGRIGKLLVGAFAVGKIIQFGKECVDLGSDLSEVQNVVDVTFGALADDVNKFAENAISSLGLSETSAKQYTSVMGAMLKSMGISTGQALEMSKAMTALSADMASFYNLDTEKAFEKIRSGISGETEPLKQLGINMSVANLQAYAMSQGIDKAYSKMSQQEQALLRYNYLLSVTADAQGDFARTSDSYANQTRILAEQFNALKAEIGQGLIAALTPVVKALNVVINKLRVAAGYFRAFMELIFGKQSSGGGSGMADIAESTESIADTASDASNAVGGVGDSAEKAGKKAKKAAKGATAAFDELNQLSKASDSSESGGSGSGSGGTGGLENMGGSVDVDLGEVEEGATKLDGLFGDVINQLKHMKDLFAEGFKMGISTADFEALKNAMQSVKDGFLSVFGDGTVLSAFTNMLNSMSLNLGKVVGSIASVGVSIATNLIGGFGKYLDQNSGYIKERLIGIFDASAEISDTVGNFAIAFADIFSVFGGDTAQQCTANIISIFANAFLGATELALKFGRDLIENITKPIIENKDKIKEALENSLGVFETLSGTVSEFITNIFSKAIEVYDTYIAPGLEKIGNGVSQVFGAILDAYNTYLAPTLQKCADGFSKLYEEHIRPFVDKFLEVWGKAVNMIGEFWQNVLAPFFEWVISYITPAVSTVINTIWKTIETIIAQISDLLTDLLSILEGVIDFLTGVFSGDWDKAWEGIKEVVNGIGDLLYDWVIGGLQKIVDWLTDIFLTCWENGVESIKNFFSPLANWFNNTVIQPTIEFFSNLWETIKTKASEAWESIAAIWTAVSNWFSSTVIEPIKAKFTEWKTSVTNLGKQASDGVKNAWNAISSWFTSTIITPVKTGFSNAWNNIKTLASSCVSGIRSVFQSFKSWIDGIINSIRSTFSSLWSNIAEGCRSAINGVLGKVESGINNMTSKVNSVTSKVGINIPSVKVPKLARGGIVDGATFMGNYIAGEAGKEMIVPLENTAFVDKLASSLGNAVMSAMSTSLNASNGFSGNSGQNVSLEMDGMILARTITPYIVKEMKRLDLI